MKPMSAPWRTPIGSRNPSERALIARPASSPATVAPNMTPARSRARTHAFKPKKNTSEHGGPVVLHADHGPAVASGLLQGALAAGRVGELPVLVVVQDEQPQERRVGVPREVEHRAVTVAVPGGEQRPAADPAPDPDRLLGAVVEVVEHGGVGDRAAGVVAGVGQRDGAADRALAGHAVELL